MKINNSLVIFIITISLLSGCATTRTQTTHVQNIPSPPPPLMVEGSQQGGTNAATTISPAGAYGY